MERAVVSTERVFPDPELLMALDEELPPRRLGALLFRQKDPGRSARLSPRVEAASR
jgi:hypothetical protein